MDTDQLDEAITASRTQVAELTGEVFDRPDLEEGRVASVAINGWAGSATITFSEPDEKVVLGMGVTPGTPAGELLAAVGRLEELLGLEEEAQALAERLRRLGVQE